MSRTLALTAREVEVAQLVSEGLTNKAIALRLSLSESTIKSHVEHCFSKTGTESRVALSRLIWRGGQPHQWDGS